MSEIKAVVATAACICVAAALASLVSYKGKLDGASRGAIAIIILSAVSVPLANLADAELRLPEISVEELLPSGEAEYEKVGREALQNGLRRMIAEKFSISEQDISVTVIGFDFSSMRAEKICVLLRRGAAASDIRAIRDYVTDEGIGECEVEIEI